MRYISARCCVALAVCIFAISAPIPSHAQEKIRSLAKSNEFVLGANLGMRHYINPYDMCKKAHIRTVSKAVVDPKWHEFIYTELLAKIRRACGISNNGPDLEVAVKFFVETSLYSSYRLTEKKNGLFDGHIKTTGIETKSGTPYVDKAIQAYWNDPSLDQYTPDVNAGDTQTIADNAFVRGVDGKTYSDNLILDVAFSSMRDYLYQKLEIVNKGAFNEALKYGHPTALYMHIFKEYNKVNYARKPLSLLIETEGHEKLVKYVKKLYDAKLIESYIFINGLKRVGLSIEGQLRNSTSELVASNEPPTAALAAVAVRQRIGASKCSEFPLLFKDSKFDANKTKLVASALWRLEKGTCVTGFPGAGLGFQIASIKLIRCEPAGPGFECLIKPNLVCRGLGILSNDPRSSSACLLATTAFERLSSKWTFERKSKGKSGGLSLFWIAKPVPIGRQE